MHLTAQSQCNLVHFMSCCIIGITFDIKLKEYSKKQSIVYFNFDIYMYTESLAPSLTNFNFQTTSTKGYIHPYILTKIS